MTLLDAIAGVARSGVLYGIGVGPGDIRYLTLRAAGVVRSVDVIAFFAKRGREGNARSIVHPLMRPEQAELRLEYPVTEEIPVSDPEYRERISGFYEDAAAMIAERLRGGLSVGLLAEGDPFFYGSFMHMWRRLEGDAEVEVVPGVSGMSGCWSHARAPITWGDDILTVLPGTLAEERLTERLRGTDAAVVMKLGRNLQKVRRAVEAAKLIHRAIYVERGTMTAEKIRPLAECRDERSPYFSLVLIPGCGRRL